MSDDKRWGIRLGLGIWIAEMLWASFFAVKHIANENTCSTEGFVFLTMLFAANYIVPLWFVADVLYCLIIGKPEDARGHLDRAIEKAASWYKAGPTLTFIAIGLLAWTAYNVSFRYHVTLESRDAYDGDYSQVRTVKDSLTGEKTQRVFTEDECIAAEQAGDAR